jgi:DNA processing protein
VVPLDHGAARRLGVTGLERLARAEIARARSESVSIETIEDEAYPALLREIADPPPVLYVRGTLEPDDEVRVAVVGSRSATGYGLDAAHLLARDLALCGVTIVSGLARGIDRRAHEGALEAETRTIAVLGSGLGRLYPREHGKLARATAARGAVVTEYPFDMPPLSSCFPRRNRVISGLSAGVVVVEAATASGALGTARLALDQGREVFAVPGPATHPTSVGTNGLLRAGAAHLACLSLDVLDELPVVFRVRLGLPALVSDEPEGPRRAAFALPLGAAAFDGLAGGPGRGPKTPLDPETAAVLRHLNAGESLSMDELVSRCGLPVQRALAALSILEMRGLAEALPGDRVAKAVRPR